jgi:phospholipase C
MKLTRRTALKALGALAGAAATSPLLHGCGPSGSASTMVFMMMENRTYDNLLGSRSLLEGLPGDGLVAGMTNPDREGRLVGLSSPPISAIGPCVLDPPHEWGPSRAQWNRGANDGFVRTFEDEHPGASGDVVMEYLTRAHAPVLYALADAYTTCDRWFSSVLGPTLPNRMYWIAAQSNGAKSNADVLGGDFSNTPTIYDRLENAGVDWAYYFGDFATIELLPQFASDPRVRPFAGFLDDAKAGKLPPVVYIDPSFAFNDYHPPHSTLLGEQLIAATYQALATSSQWRNCTLTITFDEHGGFHDHVAPGVAPDERAADGFGQLGFRVPALVIGPHVKRGHVCSMTRDHTSVLRHLGNRFDLPALSMRDAAATDLSSCIDETAAPTAPIALPTVEVDESMFRDPRSKAFDDHVMLKWAAYARLDVQARKRQALHGVHAIGEYLERHNLGRIRRGR